MRVRNQFVLLEPVKAENETPAGILMPETGEKPEIGIVKSLGVVTSLKEGDKVVYKKWVSHDFKYEGKDYIFVEEKDILAIL